jgi:flagellar biosynthetic protein FliR
MDVEALLARFADEQVAAFFLVLARVGPLFLLAPLFSSKSLPARAKTLVALALAVGLAPIALRTGPGSLAELPLDAVGYAALLFKELLVGVAFAFALAALFAAILVAGSLLDTLIGFSYGQIVDPLTGNPGGALQQLYSLIGVAVFIAIEGDAWVIQGLAKTYELVPLLGSPELGSLVGGAQRAFSGVMGASVQVAAPVMLAVILTDCAFGVVSKAMPQLNVFAVGFPAKVTLGLILIGASLPFVAGWLHDELANAVLSALGALKAG